MFLFTILTLLALINSFASRIVSLVLSFVPQDKSIESISSDIIRLKKEQSLIPMVDEFAKHARLQRKIIKLQEEKKSLSQAKAAKLTRLRFLFLGITYGITTISQLLMVWMWRGEVIHKLPIEWLWPVPKMFNWFGDHPGSISLVGWILISSVASRTIARTF